MEYYIATKNNEKLGPLTLEQLKGHPITSETKVWRTGMESWTKAELVDELKDLINDSSPPDLIPANQKNSFKASRGDRFVAYLIDSLIITPFLIIPYVGWLPSLAYMLLRDALPFLDGQSLGKKIMKLRVVNAEGLTPITEDYGKSALRTLPLSIPVFQLIDALAIFGDDELRFGDKWAKTLVIKEQS